VLGFRIEALVRIQFLVAIFISVTAAAFAGGQPAILRQKAPSVEVTPLLLQPVWRHLARSSGQIFAGTVLYVERQKSALSGPIATTSIRFRVDEAIRGVKKGQTLEVKEWAGLWQTGERYHPGERVLLFLYPPSRLGLTSPVGHQAGRFPVESTGRVLIRDAGVVRTRVEIRKVVRAIRQAERE
jgi:hypothetical protein